MNQTLETGTAVATAPGVISPTRLAHVVMRTSQFDALVNWYQTVLGARVVFTNGSLAFLAYDDEHHRVAVIHVPDLKTQPHGSAGVHHIAFTYASMGDLVATYERLDKCAIHPVWCVNHGPTTSMYFADPDGNQVELQVDNYASVEEAGEFFYSPAFATNPIGVDFDPAELARRFRAGEDELAIKRRPDGGARGVESIPLH